MSFALCIHAVRFILARGEHPAVLMIAASVTAIHPHARGIALSPGHPTRAALRC